MLVENWKRALGRARLTLVLVLLAAPWKVSSALANEGVGAGEAGAAHVRVTLRDGGSPVGRIAETSGHEIHLETDGGARRLAWSEVARLEPLPAPRVRRVVPTTATVPAVAKVADATAVAAPAAAAPDENLPPPPPPPPPPPGEASARISVPLDAPTVRQVERAVAVATKAPTAVVKAAPVPSPWHYDGAISLGYGEGNSNYFDLRLDGSVKRDQTPWGGMIGFTFVFGRKEGEDITNNWKVIGRLERKIRGCAYGFGQVLYERDLFADLLYRLTYTVGAGYTFVDTKWDTFKGELGLGVTQEKRVGLESTVDPSGWLGLDYEHRWPGDRKFQAIYALRPNFGEFGLSAQTLELKYVTPCFSCANILISVRFDHTFDPPDDVEPLDILLTVGFSFEV